MSARAAWPISGSASMASLKAWTIRSGADVGIAEALRQPMRQRLLETVMVEDEREDEAAQGGLMPCDRLRLLADAVPDRIELLDGWVLAA